MIWQSVLDFLRDTIVNWISGMNDLFDGAGFTTAGEAVGGAAADAGHFLALFVGGSGWAAAVSAFGAYTLVWLTTGLIAIVARRGTAS